MRFLMLLALCATTAFAQQAPILCQIEVAGEDYKYTQIIRFDEKAKSSHVTRSVGVYSEDSFYNAKYGSFTKAETSANFWSDRISRFEEYADKKIDLSSAYKIEKILNDDSHDDLYEFWRISDKEGKILYVLSTADIDSYYVCPELE